jgi:hypothetical protein
MHTETVMIYFDDLGAADQEIAAFTSSATFFSTTGLHFLSA